MAGEVWPRRDLARRGATGMAGQAWQGMAGSGVARQGKALAGKAGLVPARQGMAGEAWRGSSRSGMVGHCMAWQAWFGTVGLGKAGTNPGRITVTNFKIGDLIAHKHAPITVQITSVEKCDDDGCVRDVVVFADPETGEEDAAHADEFRLA